MKQIAVSLLLLAAAPALATTVVLGTDAQLFDQAELVVEGTVLAAGPSRLGLAATEYRVRVERTVKGRSPAGELIVRVPGGPGPDGRRLILWGAPRMKEGERALLFLGRYPEGDWGPLHLSMGAFHEVEAGGRRLALRDLSEMQDLSTGGPAADRSRDFDRFAGWLADRAAGLRRPADYFVEAPASGLASVQDKFTYLQDIHQRWLEFDQGRSIGWRAHTAGQQGLAGGGFTQFQTALQAWNDDPATNIRYRYDGTTTRKGGLRVFDGVNALLFDDPNGEVGGTFTCSSPGNGFGVLASGGTWIDDSEPEPIHIQGGDIVVNDGAGCWFTTAKRAEQVYAHELGHTLGLGHSCGDSRSGSCNTSLVDDALMRANAHADDRGARLNADDRAGILSLYPAGGIPGGKPAAPADLTATAVSASSIRLDWLDIASNETSYRVEMKTTGSFQEILSLPADSTSALVTGLASQTAYTFRVRARNAKGASGYSNQATATTPPSIPAAPAGLTATAVSTTAVRLDWDDRSSNETGFRIERSSPATGWTLLDTVPADTETYLAAAQPDTPYSFRVRALGAGGNSAFSNVASVTTPGGATGPCVPGADNLCLLGDRFRVAAHWRALGTDGPAHAVAHTDQSGLFWFFSSDNIELIVKVLDARNPFGSFWVFYGGLSDVEYWITVTDTETGAARTYHNEQGNLCGNADVGAFPEPAPAPGSAAAPVRAVAAPQETGCGSDPGALCLQGGRFQVTVHWQTGDGEGDGTPVPLTDQSGLFWFFNAENVELVVKVLDGRTVNDKFWVFYGALSDVDYTIRVVDTTNEATRTYHNDQGNLCGRADVDAFEP